jgi:hypothetical protein
MRQSVTLLALAIAATVSVHGQSEAALREYFQGMNVTAKADLPAGKAGVDIYPDAAPAINKAQLDKQVRRFGVAFRRYDAITIKDVKVTARDIEVEFGPNESGTANSETAPTVSVATAPSQAERKIEQDIDRETDPARREKMQEDLNELILRRAREEARLKAAMAQLAAARAKDASDQPRATSTTRLDLLFPAGVPSRVLSPEYLIAALTPWIDFDRETSSSTAQDLTPAATAQVPNQESLPSIELRKGLTEVELRRMFGDPIKREPRTVGDLHVELLTFKENGTTIEATMVEGVLVRFTESSY